jgi:hypothetical protein
MKRKKYLTVDGDVWRRAAQRLARAIVRFNENRWQNNLTDSTVCFAYRVKKGNV